MKKLFLIMIICVVLFALSACNKAEKHEGSYIEITNYGNYTANVEVSVKDDKITKVNLLNTSNIHTDAIYWPDYTIWTKGVNAYLESYNGVEVSSLENATTLPVDGVAGATLSSNRLFYAIKDALFGTKYEGSYIEETDYGNYSAYVEVYTQNGKIKEIKLLENSNIHTDSNYWPDYTVWEKGLSAHLNSYVGKDILTIVNASSLPVDAVTGASISSQRLFLAIQNALKS